MLLSITGCFWARADYTRRCLDALARCDGIADCVFRPGCEPGCEEVIAMLRGFDACTTEVTINRQRLGCNLNTVASIERGFGISDFVLHVEDDVLLAPDALRYFAWARDHYRDNPNILTVTGYNRTPERGCPEAVHTRKWFHPWGWATWIDRWNRIRAHNYDSKSVTWDVLISRNFIDPADSPYRELYPALSRVQNIGAKSSIHGDWFSPEWHAQNQRAQHWTGDGLSEVPNPCLYRDEGETPID
jgi:hypothetical protein